MLSQDKQKRLLLDLLSTLNDADGEAELEEDEGIRGQSQKTLHSMDLADEGVEHFHGLARELNNLDDALRNFSNSARLLGSSVDILSSTYHLRERLTVIRYLFRENAAHLFPQKIVHAPAESLHRPAVPDRRRSQSRIHSNTRRLPVLNPPTHEDFPNELDMLAKNMISFLLDFNDLLDYPDEALNLPVMSFEEDVKYWASCLKDHEGQLKSPPVRRYLHDLSVDMSEHIGLISRYLSTFNETCIPTIRDMQRHGGRNSLNLSMLATVFCAVAATTLQFSFNLKGDLNAAVNGFWFTSIVLSIAAAGNSLLGLAWKQAMYRAPGRHVPWWVIAWLRRSPLVFLVMAVTCFTVGLVIFSYSSMQKHAVVIFVAGVTGFSSIGFTSVISWYALERLAFARHYGSRLHELRRLSVFFKTIFRPCRVMASVFGRRRALQDPEGDGRSPPSAEHLRPSVSVSDARTYPVKADIPIASPGQARFQHAVRTVLMRRESRIDMQQSKRTSTLTTHLRGLRPIEPLPAHTALVRHLQFSPNGKLLATSSWDRTSVILQAVSPSTPRRTLSHPSGFVSEVAWSPNGAYLLTKLTRSINIWTEAGECMTTIPREHPIQSIAWLPGGDAFLAAEGDSVTVLRLSGDPIDRYQFKRLRIRGITITADGSRLLVVGTLNHSEDGLRPGKGRDEKRIVSYNRERRKIECQVPVLDDVRDITITKNGLHALVSYECKAPQLWKIETYRQRSDITASANAQDPSTNQNISVITSRLSLQCTYMAHAEEGFSAPGCFGGADDELVICASKSGDIHIWDRDSSSLLHQVHARDLGGSNITCIASNPVAGPYLFATGRHDGAVRIWTTMPPGQTETPPSNDDEDREGSSDASVSATLAARTPVEVPELDGAGVHTLPQVTWEE